MSIVIIGAGPNLGAAVARRFGREGMPVGLVSLAGRLGPVEVLEYSPLRAGIGVSFAGEVAYARMHTDRGAFQVRLGTD